ncbi:hypothetical protein EVAR_62010_1 [Eumeta japonica]|uniref:Uncharacterized protein n=1 Tax=Eumeta variegata TaxID=151549 RepID=A0A4C1ZQ99_EUMVA|nr:hypothetical protein EVAR_62010_1 [Eumeta japonica]
MFTAAESYRGQLGFNTKMDRPVPSTHGMRTSAVEFRPLVLTHPPSKRSPYIRHPIPSQEAGDALATPLELRVSMSCGDHPFSDGSPARLPLECAIDTESRSDLYLARPTLDQQPSAVGGRIRAAVDLNVTGESTDDFSTLGTERASVACGRRPETGGGHSEQKKKKQNKLQCKRLSQELGTLTPTIDPARVGLSSRTGLDTSIYLALCLRSGYVREGDPIAEAATREVCLKWISTKVLTRLVSPARQRTFCQGMKSIYHVTHHPRSKGLSL